MLMMTKKILGQIPKLLAQDGKGEDAIAYVKFFIGSFTWYGTEYESNEFFGKVYSHLCPDGELGYFRMEDLLFVNVERDLNFKPTKLSECKNPCVR